MSPNVLLDSNEQVNRNVHPSVSDGMDDQALSRRLTRFSTNDTLHKVTDSRNADSPKKLRKFPGEGDNQNHRQSTQLREYEPPHNALQARLRSVGVEDKDRISSPWKSLRFHFTLSLGDSEMLIASGEDRRFVAIKRFSQPLSIDKIDLLNKIRHDNILKYIKSFNFEAIEHVMFEHEEITGERLSINLSQYALIFNYPTESQLAIILGQILHGLRYLESMDLQHGRLSCKNILISTEGSIRIACQEDCQKLDRSNPDVRAIGDVMMELMNKAPSDGGSIQVTDTGRWPLDSRAVLFLLRTASATSIQELIQDDFFGCERRSADIRDIKANVYIAEATVRRKCNSVST